jgi:hypothetical protein
LIPALSALYEDQNLNGLRFTYPRKFLFLCGGATPRNPVDNKAINLRDYLYRIKKLQRRLKADVVLAETATTLYPTFPGFRAVVGQDRPFGRLGQQ